MSLRTLALVLAIAPCCLAVEIATVMEALRRSGVPDTADYRMTTSLEVSGRTLRTSAHIVQAGLDRQWSETNVSGRTIRMVRDGERQRVEDLSTGAAQTMQVPASPGTPQTRWTQARTSAWSDPVAVGNGIWEFHDDHPDDSTLASQRLRWSEVRGEVVSLCSVSKQGDSSRIDFSWQVIQGRKLPRSFDIQSRIEGGLVRTTVSFTDWSFPRSFPARMFVIP